MLDPATTTAATRTALMTAAKAAADHGHALIEPVHLAHGLLADPDAPARRLAERAGAQVPALVSALAAALGALPRQQPAPPQPGLAKAGAEILERAAKDQRQRGDSHLASESLLMALLGDRTVGPLAAKHGLDAKALEAAIVSVRQGRTVQDEHAETTYEALAKYGRDLVALAKSGKLDPVGFPGGTDTS